MNLLFRKVSLIGFLLHFISGFVFAQCTVYNLSVPITITGANLSIKGNYENLGTATINNADTIDLTGHFTNNSTNNCFGTSQGTVILKGVGNQILGGTQVTAFNNLRMDNGTLKSLGNDIIVGGTYANPSGILDIGFSAFQLLSNTVTVTNPAPSAIVNSTVVWTGCIFSEFTDNSSKVIWKIGNNTGAHVVPFGNQFMEPTPFTYNLISGNAGDVTMSTYRTPPSNLPMPTTPVAVSHIRNNAGVNNSANMVDRYWHIETTGIPQAEFTFSWGLSETAANGSVNPRGQNWNVPQISWTIPFAGQTNPTTESVIVPGITILNHGTWTIALDASPLPVELLSFTANAENNDRVRCDWITASEINNDFFTVQRSKDGIHFEDVGIVDGAGTASDLNDYFFYDMQPYSGLSYYRLMQTDFDGSYSYSVIVPVRLKSSSGVAVYPTLVTDEIQIEADSDFNFSLYTTEGKLIFDKEFFGSGTGYKTFHVSRNGIASGVYFARILSNNGQLHTQKLIFR